MLLLIKKKPFGNIFLLFTEIEYMCMYFVGFFLFHFVNIFMQYIIYWFQYVHYKSTGHLWRSEVKVVTYTSGKTWSTMFKDKGGAYTFVPDGPAEVRVTNLKISYTVHPLMGTFNSPQQSWWILLDNVIVTVGISGLKFAKQIDLICV